MNTDSEKKVVGMAVRRIALIADIHGNIPALEAVLADIARRMVDAVYVLGDLVGKGPESAETVDRIRAMNTIVIKGNWDEAMLLPDMPPSMRWHQQQLGAERLAYLHGLPYSHDFRLGGKQIRLFHASAKGLWHRVFSRSDQEERLAMFENTDLVGGAEAPVPDVVGYADIHYQYLLQMKNKTLFNTGSSGNPLDFPDASYVILEGSIEGDGIPLSLQFLRVKYDREEAIRRAFAADMPDLEAYIQEIRTARYRLLPKE